LSPNLLRLLSGSAILWGSPSCISTFISLMNWQGMSNRYVKGLRCNRYGFIFSAARSWTMRGFSYTEDYTQQ
jgi:hypothetical protein